MLSVAYYRLANARGWAFTLGRKDFKLTRYAGFGPKTRGTISHIVHEILSDNDFTVAEQTRPIFLKALDLYGSRLDKGYSLTDCISMNVCRELGIKEVLTHDRHFEQEGFEILL